MEKIFIIGNLTRDPEYSETSAGVAVCKFTVAVNHADDGADFFPVTAFRKLAESVSRYTRKGKKIAVLGDLKIKEYETKSGERRISAEVVASTVEFLHIKEE